MAASVVALDRGIAWIAASWLWVVNLAVAAWLALIVSAPLLLAVGKEGLATVLYAMNQPLCHQRADRSFHLLGEKMACCERCFAIYAATFGFGLVFTVLRRLEPLSWRCAALLSLPVLLDALSQAPGWRESTTSLRVLTGALFAIGASWVVFPALARGCDDLRTTIAARVENGAAVWPPEPTDGGGR
jgi:uncharacterized membrane protein